MAFLSPMAASMSSLTSSRASAAYSATLDDVDPETEMAPWFMAGVPRVEVRQVAMDMLKQGQIGNFLVRYVGCTLDYAQPARLTCVWYRDVKSEPNCYGISIKNSQNKLVNYLIEKSSRKQDPGYQIRGTKQAFPTIFALVTYYAAAKRSALGIQLIVGDPSTFLADSSDEDGSGFNSDTSSSGASDATVKANQASAAPLTDADRWALNADREDADFQRTLGRSTKAKAKKPSIIKATAPIVTPAPSQGRKPRKARKSSSQRSSTSRLEAVRPSFDVPYSLPQHQLQMQLQQMQLQQMQMQQMNPYGMMGSVLGVPAMSPQGSFYPSAPIPSASASELQIR